MRTSPAIFALFLFLAAATASAEERAEDQPVAEGIAARIREALEGEDYTVEEKCGEEGCTITIVRGNDAGTTTGRR